jgi:3-oxoacyl-[acyl-carrier protein] reductase
MGDLFKDKVVLVTGSGQGIGRAVALAFAAEGAKVVTNNRKPGGTGLSQMTDEQYKALTPEQKKKFDDSMAEISGDAESTAKTIIERGGQALPIYCDISKKSDVEKMVRQVVEKWGTVHILINVAGAFANGPITEITEEAWDRVTNIKPKGYFNVIQQVVPLMQKQHWGRIINTTSKAFMGDIIKFAQYCAANAGCVGLTQGAACELFGDGITVNAFAPWARTRASYEGDYVMGGDTAIGGQRSFPPAEYTPEPDALAPFLQYLCTDDAKDITGTVFTLAGNQISMHQFPVVSKSINKYSKDYWTVDELKFAAPHGLFAGYQNILNFQ